MNALTLNGVVLAHLDDETAAALTKLAERERGRQASPIQVSFRDRPSIASQIFGPWRYTYTREPVRVSFDLEFAIESQERSRLDAA